MIFITGEAYSGKTEYAVSLGIQRENILNGGDMDMTARQGVICVKNYHLLVKRLVASGGDPMRFTKELTELNGDAVIISDEIGSGIIPLDRRDRLWREETGRVCCFIAAEADKVIRMVCGIPCRIK